MCTELLCTLCGLSGVTVTLYSACILTVCVHCVFVCIDLYMNLEEMDQNGLQAVLRDLSTTLQMLGRLAEHLSGVHFSARIDSAKMLFDRYARTYVCLLIFVHSLALCVFSCTLTCIICWLIVCVFF